MTNFDECSAADTLVACRCGACEKGHWCNGQVDAEFPDGKRPCVLGSYNVLRNAESEDACLACPIGNFCPTIDAAPVDCDDGSFNAVEGRSEPCAICPAGSFCVDKDQDPVPCAAGTFNAKTGMNVADACVECVQGTFNPNEGSAGCQNCLAGTFGEVAGATDPDDCTICTPRAEQCGGGNTCGEGYAGWMCAKCQEAPDPYYLSGETCKECPLIPTAAIGMGVVFVLSAVWFVRTDLSQWQQPVEILRNTFSDRTRCIAQLRPGPSFLLSVLRFLDRVYASASTGLDLITGALPLYDMTKTPVEILRNTF